MARRERAITVGVLEARERYVSRGVSKPRLIVGRAEGAHVEDVDGRGHLDFAGGLACQNVGHGFAPVVAAIRSTATCTSASWQFRARAERLGVTLRARLGEIAGRHEAIGEVRGLGPMLAIELREPSPELAQAVTASAFEHGPLLLACGLDGNVLRLLPPLTIAHEELDRGLQLLEESLAAAAA